MSFNMEQLIKIIAQQLVIDPAAVKPESNLSDDLGIQSVDFIKIVMAIEDRFDVEFDDVDLENIQTVTDAYGELSRQMA